MKHWTGIDASVRQAALVGRRSQRVGVATLSMLVGVGMVGCVGSGSGSGGIERESQQSRRMGPADDVDPDRAYLSLEEIKPALKPAGPNPDSVVEPSRRTIKRIAAAKLLIGEQRYTEAVAELEKALRYDPVYAPTYRMLGIACRRSGAAGRASAFLNKSILYDPTDFLSHYHLAMVYADGGEKDQALHHFRVAWECRDMDPALIVRPLVALELARLLEDEGYLSAAMGLYEYFERARAEWNEQELNDPVEVDFAAEGPESAALQIGRLNEQLGRLDRANAAYERALRYAPDDLVVQTGKARLLMRLGRIDEARGLTRRLLSAAREEREWEEVCSLYALSPLADALLEDLKDLAAGPNPSARVLRAVFDASREAGDVAEAERALQRLMEIDSNGDGSVYGLAVDFYLSQGRGSQAIEILAAGLAERPRRLDPIAASADRIATDPESARAVLASASQLLGDESRGAQRQRALQYLLARVAVYSGNEEAAREWLEALIDAPVGYSAAYVLLGELRLRQARWEQAIADVEAGLKRDEALNQSADAHVVLARAYEALDDVEQAEEHYELAIARQRDDAGAIFALGELLTRKGEPLRARRTYQDLLTLAPDHEEAHEALVRNYLIQREVQLARDQLAQMEESVGQTRAYQRCLALWDFSNELGSSRRSQREVARDYAGRLEALFEEDPTDVATGVDLAGVLCEPLREYKRAGELLDRLLSIEPYEDQALELRIFSYNKLLEFERSAQFIETLLERFPKRDAWRRQLAQVYLILQDYKKTSKLLERLIASSKVDADRNPLRMYLLDVYVLSDQVGVAVDAAHRWEAEAEPQAEGRDFSPFVWRDRLIRDLIAVGGTESALTLAEEWYERSPEESVARVALMNCLMALWDRVSGTDGSAVDESPLDRAVMLALEWLEDDPDNFDLNRRLITLELLRGRNRAAVELAWNIVAGADRKERLRGWLAQVLMDAGRKEEAVRIFRRLARNSGDMDDYRRAAAAMIDARQFEEAERYLVNLRERLGSGIPQSANMLFLLYVCYLSWDKSTMAEEQLTRLVEGLEPHSFENNPELAERYFGCCNDLGYVWADKGRDLGRADEMIRLAVAYAPQRAAYLDSLGWVEYKLGDLESARKWLERAIRAQRYEAILGIRGGGGVPGWVLRTSQSGGTQDAVLHQHLGDTYWALGLRDDAAELWREAATLIERRASGDELTPDEEQTRGDLVERIEALERGDEPPIAGKATVDATKEGD